MVPRFRGLIGAVIAVVTVIATTGVVAAGGVPAGATAAPTAPLGGSTSTSVDVPMSCGGTPTSVQITLTMPRLARAGGTFELSATNAQTDDLQLALTNTTPTTVDVPGSTRTQLVASGNSGQAISVSVTGAVQFVPETVDGINFYDPVQCTPTAPTTLASIRLIGGLSSPTVAHVDSGAVYECGLDGIIAGFGNVRQSFDVPTQVAHGATFSLPGISGPGPFETPYLFANADGATATPPFLGFNEIGPASVLTVTAPPGGVVTIRQNALSTASIIGAFCNTVGPGVLATIPVT